MLRLSINIMLNLMKKNYKSSNKKIVIALKTISVFIKLLKERSKNSNYK